ncbi:hypothetical protein AMST5_03383 [freshwater sediment metagenome]|uniref:DUF3102 domain-containing protein n=1 Tax=freshwater sediment metagenome TaxID=556182 RepID=A0AA48RFC1_9ZZZZ
MTHDLVTTGQALQGSSDKLELFKKRMHEARDRIYRDAEQWQDSAVAFGETISEAKYYFPHGAFGPWCKSELGLSDSQRAAYLRLYKAREDLDQAREWARKTGHQYADALSVDRLLRIVGEWNVATGRKPPSARKAKSGAKAFAVKSEIAANEQADVIEVITMPPPHIIAASEPAVNAILDYKFTTGEDVLQLTLDYIAAAVRSRASQSHGLPQVSGPAKPESHSEEQADNAVVNGTGEAPSQRLRRLQENYAGRN